MAKSMVINKLGNRRFTHYWPANFTNAQTLADAVLDGEYDIYESKGVVGNEDVAGEYWRVTVMGYDNTTKKKLYLNFAMPLSKTEDDIYTALQSKTFNGVKFDVVYTLRMSKEGSPAQSGGGSGGNP